jgi:hypothetical protein
VNTEASGMAAAIAIAKYAAPNAPMAIAAASQVCAPTWAASAPAP